jgi:hypothetical protein
LSVDVAPRGLGAGYRRRVDARIKRAGARYRLVTVVTIAGGNELTEPLDVPTAKRCSASRLARWINLLTTEGSQRVTLVGVEAEVRVAIRP